MGLINLVSTTKARLYTFLGGKTAKSAEVNGELNQLVTAHNSLLTDLAAVNAAIDTITGVGWAGDTIVSLKAGDIAKDTAQTGALNTHKTSSDHDGRYFTEAEVTSLVNAVTAALTTHKASADHDGRYFTETEVTAIQNLLQGNIDSSNSALATHKTSSDHDGRYFTEAEITALLATRDGNLNTHKTSTDHDGRYFTEAEVTALLNVIQGMVDTDILALTTHKASADHDARYNTKAEIIDLVSPKADWESIYTATELSSTTAEDTGAHLIGANVGGIVGDNVHAILLALRDRINDAVGALIVDGSVTDIKLSDEPTAIKARVAQLELDYPELFLSVSSGKNLLETAVVDMRGTVSQAGDYPTFAELDAGVRSIPQGKGNALVADVLAPKTFTNNDGVEYTGTMVDRGSVGTINLTTEGAEYTIPVGKHNGLGKVKAVITGLVASVIKAGTTVGGILGTFTADATMVAADLLAGKTGYKNGAVVTGTLPKRNNTDTGGSYPDAVGASFYEGMAYLMPSYGFYDGTVWVKNPQPNLTGANLKAGVTLGSITGTFTSDATSLASDILSGKTSYVNGVKVTGTIPSKGAQTYTPTATAQTIAAGQYLSGVQTIAGVAVSKFATGTVTTADYSVLVSGLTFKPKSLFLTDGANMVWYDEQRSAYNIYRNSGSGGAMQPRNFGDYGGYITATGFLLRIDDYLASGRIFTWYARA